MSRSKRSMKLGPPPPPTSPAVTAVMKSNLAKDTGPEKMLRAALREQGLTGYRLNWKKAPGRPDIAFPGKEVAIFVNGCFWHRCPKCNLPLPKSNQEFWNNKFILNRERDAEKARLLEARGWKVFVFWECEIKDNADKCAIAVKRHMEQIKVI